MSLFFFVKKTWKRFDISVVRWIEGMKTISDFFIFLKRRSPTHKKHKTASKRLSFALVVLDAVKSKFPETKEFIDDTLKDEWQKEKWWGNFFTSLEAKN